MIGLNIFKAIDNFFTNGVFLPLKSLRFDFGWWGSNTINWIFMVVLIVYLAYWMKQCKMFKDEGTEDLPK